MEVVRSSDLFFFSTIEDNLKTNENCLKNFDKIIDSANRLAKYVPQATDCDQNFWKNTVIYSLNQNFFQMAQSRQCIRQCLSIIGSIAENTMDLSTRGLSVQAKFSKILLPPALDKFCDDLNNLIRQEKSALKLFEDQIDTIFRVPGADAFVGLNQIKFVQKQLDKCLNEKTQLLDELQDNQDEIQALKTSISRIETEICQLQGEIYKIHFKIKKYKHAGYYIKLKIGGAKRRDKYARAKYYENLLTHKSKLSQRLKSTRDVEKKRLQELTSSLISLRSKFEYKNHLVRFLDANESRATDLEQKLGRLKADMDKLHNHQTLFEEHQKMVGLRDEEYVGFLNEFREFSYAIKMGAQSYAPIIAILKEIKSVIQSPIELMASDEVSDVVLAHKMLSRYCPYLLRLSRSLRQGITSHHHKRSWLLIKD